TVIFSHVLYQLSYLAVAKGPLLSRCPRCRQRRAASTSAGEGPPPSGRWRRRAEQIRAGDLLRAGQDLRRAVVADADRLAHLDRRRAERGDADRDLDVLAVHDLLPLVQHERERRLARTLGAGDVGLLGEELPHRARAAGRLEEAARRQGRLVERQRAVLAEDNLHLLGVGIDRDRIGEVEVTARLPLLETRNAVPALERRGAHEHRDHVAAEE